MKQDNTTKFHILIVEDDTALAGGLCRALQNEAAETVSCGTLREAREMLSRRIFELVLLDVNLPDGNGFDFLQEIKKEYDICVIMLTANDMETDIVAGLEMGADDYITKPFSLAVLRARVEVQLRRVEVQLRQENEQLQQTAEAGGVVEAKQTAQELESGHVIAIDDYRFDFTRMLFARGEEQIELSKTEQKLLRILVENKGMTLTREQLLNYVWSTDAEFVDENALSVTVKRLRDKLGAQTRIRTVYGIGYRWE